MASFKHQRHQGDTTLTSFSFVPFTENGATIYFMAVFPKDFSDSMQFHEYFSEGGNLCTLGTSQTSFSASLFGYFIFMGYVFSENRNMFY